jgi:hypothetical protein
VATRSVAVPVVLVHHNRPDTTISSGSQMTTSSRYQLNIGGRAASPTHKEEGDPQVTLFLCERAEKLRRARRSGSRRRGLGRSGCRSFALVHHVMVNMVHHVMMHRMATTFGLHCDRLSAISGGLCVSSGLLGTSRCGLGGGGRLLGGIGRSFSALRRGGSLLGRRLSLLSGVLTGASSK